MLRCNRALILMSGFATAVVAAWAAWGAVDAKGFPDGYDAVEAAPGSHKVSYESSIARVLQVMVPPAGTTEPINCCGPRRLCTASACGG